MKALPILICEDEGLTSLRYQATLRRLGYDVVGAVGDGEQAVQAALQLAPAAILMDIEMPHLDGVAATRRIMEWCPTAIVVVSPMGTAKRSRPPWRRVPRDIW